VQNVSGAGLRIAVTGADGFVGRELQTVLRQHGCDALAVGRPGPGVPALGDTAGWCRILAGAQVVVHLAARAHVVRESAADPLEQFRAVNVAGTLSVARAAVGAGVRRFIFVSSIGVLGNETTGVAFSEDTPPRPVEPYAVSKHEAELALQALERETGLEVSIVRPPLIYGPHVKGNFLRLLKLVAAGIPLPLGAVRNCRSLVGVTNASEFLWHCAVQPLPARRLFVISDGHDTSTPELLGILATLMRRRSRVFRFPPRVLSRLAALAGRQGEYRRLTSDLAVDSRRAREQLGWRPRKSLEAGLAETVDWFVNRPQ
jgi:nucleoside-diphosphate-sugar epimerase